MKKIIILLIFLSTQVFAQGFPELRLTGSDTKFKDSTDYLILNKSFMCDSGRVKRDLYIGELGGKIYLDTARNGRVYFNGLSLTVSNSKPFGSFRITNAGSGTLDIANDSGSVHFYTGIGLSTFIWYQSPSTSLMELSSGGLLLSGDYSFPTGSTYQYRYSGGADTVYTDYDSNDKVDCNKQSGTVQTKSLNTAEGSSYAFELDNTLITTTTKILFTFGNCANTAGFPIVIKSVCSSGKCNLTIANGSFSGGAGAFDNYLQLNFLIIN